MARFFSDESRRDDFSGFQTQASAMDVMPSSDFRRQETAPPALFWRSEPAWKRWVSRTWQWLWDLEDPTPPAPPLSALNRVRAEFRNALWDLQSARANQVRDRIECARSLRELWHLRADVFKAIAVHRGQIEAQARVDSLDAHFPVRSFKQGEPRHARVTSW